MRGLLVEHSGVACCRGLSKILGHLTLPIRSDTTTAFCFGYDAMLSKRNFVETLVNIVSIILF